MLGYIILDISSTEKGVRDVDSWSDSGLCGEKVTWELLGEILFIDGEGEIEDYLPDHSIWEPLAWLVHSVVIGNGVTRIGNYAFWGFTALKEISLQPQGFNDPMIPISACNKGFTELPALTDIHFGGSMDDFYGRIAANTIEVSYPVTVHCTDGDIALSPAA